MFTPVLITPPAETPVTLAEAKLHCRVDHAADDALITGLIAAAVSHLDGWTGILGRALVTQTWRQDYADLDGILRLPLGPVTGIVADPGIRYIDADGVAQTLASTEYDLLQGALGSYVVLKSGKSWPATGDVAIRASITYTAGQAGADVPAAIKQAILLMVGDWYRNREAAVVGAQAEAIPMSATARALLAPFCRSLL